jgi:hypothetical protein
MLERCAEIDIETGGERQRGKVGRRNDRLADEAPILRADTGREIGDDWIVGRAGDPPGLWCAPAALW